MTNKTLSERIANWKERYDKLAERNIAPATAAFALQTLMMEAVRIVPDLQAENQALLAEKGELERHISIYEKSAKISNEKEAQHFSEQIASCAKVIELEAKVKELEGKGWLPIESAPKDGTTLFVIYLHNNPSIGFEGCEGYFNPTSQSWSINTGYTEHPLFWMPLPKEPTNLEE